MSTDIAKQGYVKFQSKNLGVYKKRWLVLRSQTRNEPVRLEKYEDELSAGKSEKPRTFYLSDIINIYRVPDQEKRHAIHVTIDQYEAIQFCLESEMEANAWMKMIEGEICAARDERATFPVYLMKNPKLPTHGECTMEVTEDSLRLLNHRDQEIVAWPLNKLRRYGVERSLFTIEAGRSCPTGEGEFVFESEIAQDIYDRVHNVTKTLAFNKKTNDLKASKQNSANESRRTRNTEENSTPRGSAGNKSNGWEEPAMTSEIHKLSLNAAKVKENNYEASKKVSKSSSKGDGYYYSSRNNPNEKEDDEYYDTVPSPGQKRK